MPHQIAIVGHAFSTVPNNADAFGGGIVIDSSWDAGYIPFVVVIAPVIAPVVVIALGLLLIIWPDRRIPTAAASAFASVALA